jgi:hypothetical protein
VLVHERQQSALHLERLLAKLEIHSRRDSKRPPILDTIKT